MLHKIAGAQAPQDQAACPLGIPSDNVTNLESFALKSRYFLLCKHPPRVSPSDVGGCKLPPRRFWSGLCLHCAPLVVAASPTMGAARSCTIRMRGLSSRLVGLTVVRARHQYHSGIASGLATNR